MGTKPEGHHAQEHTSPPWIVESPAKAKTIQGYLGDGYEVTASVGHIRDLPDKAADIPAKYKSEPWSRLGVDIENNFAPIYVVNADKRARVKELKDKLADADELLLATDEDREGEAIAWHLLEVLKTEGAGQADGFPRDHPGGGDPAGAGRDPRPRQGPRRRPGDPPDPGPPVRLRGLAGAVEEGHAAAVGGPCAVGGVAPGGPPRA